ncbi:MAG: tetratricopeptide repeat protein [Verrucomicrobium sp.]|nr:tetratricopeptide repeat protein [Verrucomicrobium sp.]
MAEASRRLFWLQAAAILLAGFWVFAPALSGEWLWDDDFQITANRPIQEPGGLLKIWFAPTEPDYFPLKSTLQWIQWQLWGGHALGYHLATLGMHLLAAFLLWRLLAKLSVPGAWLAGLLFAIHPVVVESVAWIAEEKNTTALPPLLLAMSAYVAFHAHGRRWDLWIAVAWFAAAMLCKTSVVMLPFILLLYVWWRRGDLEARDFFSIIPFLAVALVLGLVTAWFQAHRTAGAVASGSPLHALLFYFWKAVWPFGLLPIYPPFAPSLLWLAFLPVLALALWLGWKTWGRGFVFGVGFFVLNLVPVLGLIPMSYLQFSPVADHFAYLSLIGIVGLAAAGAEKTRRRLRDGRRRTVTGLLVLAVLLLSLAGREDAVVFHDQEAFWSAVMARNAQSWLAQYNMALVRAKQGRMEEAVEGFRGSLALKPDQPEARNNLALSLAATGHLEESAAQFQILLRLTPDSPVVHNNYGMLLAGMGRMEEAIAQFREALRLKPDYVKARNNLARLLGQ